MAFWGRAIKKDLLELAEEMGVAADISQRVIDIKELILECEDFNEDNAKVAVERIISERKQQEDREYQLQIRQIEAEKAVNQSLERDKERQFELQKLQLQRELQQLNVEAERLKVNLNTEEKVNMETKQPTEASVKIPFLQIIPKFNIDKDEMGLYLINFERCANLAEISLTDRTAYLLAVMPTEITNIIAREPPEKAKDYEYIKELLLSRYKLNSENLKQMFYNHARRNEDTWRTFTHEVTNYFNEWITEVQIQTLDQMKNLVVTEQIKRQVPYEIKEHFIDEWAKLNNPYELATKLDEYESVRSSLKMKSGTSAKATTQTNPSYSNVSPPNRFKQFAQNAGLNENRPYNPYYKQIKDKTFPNQSRFSGQITGNPLPSYTGNKFHNLKNMLSSQKGTHQINLMLHLATALIPITTLNLRVKIMKVQMKLYVQRTKAHDN